MACSPRADHSHKNGNNLAGIRGETVLLQKLNGLFRRLHNELDYAEALRRGDGCGADIDVGLFQNARYRARACRACSLQRHIPAWP